MMSGEGDVILVLSNCLVKGYHMCYFSVEIGEEFVAKRKQGDLGDAFKVENELGQLSHLQADLVKPLWNLDEHIAV